MNKSELIESIASENELSKAAAGRVLESLLNTIVKEVKKGNGVTIPGFGSFKLASRPARTGRNPSTGATIKIAAKKLPKFTAGAGFKAAVDTKTAKRKAG